jgi:hypothetical protein
MGESDDFDLDPETALHMAAELLFGIADEIPAPTPEQDLDAFYGALLATRATSLYRNLLHSMSSPTPLGPIIAIRPLAELMIRVRWISLDTDLHGQLWFADSSANELTHIREATIQVKRRGQYKEPDNHAAAIADKEADRDAAKARLKETGRNYGSHLIPNLLRMVQEIEKAQPGQQNQIRDAYDLVYRTFSPWEHSEASSFKSTATATDGGGFTYVDDVSPHHPEDLRAIATSMYASILELVTAMTGTPLPNMARLIREYIVREWKRPT